MMPTFIHFMHALQHLLKGKKWNQVRITRTVGRPKKKASLTTTNRGKLSRSLHMLVSHLPDNKEEDKI